MPDAPADAPDTAAPMIIDSHPAKDGKGASVIQPITFVLDEAVDPATVTTATIKVRAWMKGALTDLLFSGGPVENAMAIEGTATYEAATHKIIFTPVVPLPFNARVEVTIAGVKDTAGNALATNVAFDTIRNMEAAQIFYATGNAISQYYDFAVDSMGMQRKFSRVPGPGPDGSFFTADDPVTQHFDMVFDMNGRFIVSHSFQAGTDGMFYTSDDVETAALTSTYDMSGRLTHLVSNNAAGPDGMWGTADDVPNSMYVQSWMGDNSLGVIFFSSPGLDGVWRTADDQMGSPTTQFTKYEYDSMGRRTRQVVNVPGADRVPGTADDTKQRYFDLTNDSHGFVTRSVERTAGSNGIFFDADDTNIAYTQTTRDARGLATEIKLYDTAGVNGIWFDADDHVSVGSGTRRTFTYNMAGQVVEEVSWLAGSDGIMGTADDVISTYLTTVYDSKGARVSYTSTTGQGPDALWRTSDDQLGFRRTYDALH
ncbi:MAG TPA: Ig-like domain-containing protein [Kofleriaceae bacterium]|nr:Ig-like domain-containing protein [Kofleriaceae bacterium]